jgi:Putative esterase/Transposase, Mutator family
VPIYDQHGCALRTAAGALATQLVRVQDASGQAGPIVSLDTFTPQITYTLQLAGNGYAQTGTVDPTAGAGSEPTTDVPIDRTAGVAPGCHSDLPNFGGATAGDPLKLLSVKRLDPRTWELQFSTPSVTGPTGVRILLPENFDASGATRYPVLYLLHGALDSYTSWTDKGNAEALTAGFKGIVVMPDTGTGGGYVDWYNSGAFGPPAWETYHIGQLLPWIDGHLPTIAARRGRAIYTTNAIEALNRHLRKAVKTKGHFPSEDAARKLLFLAIQNARAGLDTNPELDDRAAGLQDPLRRPPTQLTKLRLHR